MRFAYLDTLEVETPAQERVRMAGASKGTAEAREAAAKAAAWYRKKAEDVEKASAAFEGEEAAMREQVVQAYRTAARAMEGSQAIALAVAAAGGETPPATTTAATAATHNNTNDSRAVMRAQHHGAQAYATQSKGLT